MVWIVMLAIDGRGRNNRRRGGAEPGLERRMHRRVGRATECQRHSGAGWDCAPVGEGSETPVARWLPSGVMATNGGLDGKTALMAAGGM